MALFKQRGLVFTSLPHKNVPPTTMTTFLSQFLDSGILFQVLKYQAGDSVTVIQETGTGRLSGLLLKHPQSAHTTSATAFHRDCPQTLQPRNIWDAKSGWKASRNESFSVASHRNLNSLLLPTLH